MADLHYTADEVRALLDGATPGPWEVDGDTVAFNGIIPDAYLLPGERDDGTGWTLADVACIRAGDAALMAASPTLAADLLTLHADLATLRAEADRMRAVLLALAVDLDGIADGIRRYGENFPVLDKTLDALSVSEDSYEHAVASYAAFALRALAGGAR